MKGTESTYRNKLAEYMGTWRNSYEKARLIEEFTFFEEDGTMKISIKNSKESFYQNPWNIGTVKPHGYTPDSNDIVAFKGHIKMDDMEAFFAINENKGLLIIAGYLTFKDEDPRSDCFVREFFYKV